MGWVFAGRNRDDGPALGTDVMEIRQPRDLRNIADLGLTLAEAKQLLARGQEAVVAAQAHDHAVLRPDCASCSGMCRVKDRRLHQIASKRDRKTAELSDVFGVLASYAYQRQVSSASSLLMG